MLKNIIKRTTIRLTILQLLTTANLAIVIFLAVHLNFVCKFSNCGVRCRPILGRCKLNWIQTTTLGLAIVLSLPTKAQTLECFFVTFLESNPEIKVYNGSK